jgi:hypothetical protein
MGYSCRAIAKLKQANGIVRSLGVKRNNSLTLALMVAVAGLSLPGCSNSKSGNDNSNANSNRSAGANANGSTAAAPRVFPKEPDPYSATMTITQEGQQPLQVEVAKMRGDRRWTLQLSGIGEVVYLEKAGLKYMMLPERKQYTELLPGSLAFSGGDVLTPTAMLEKLGKTRAEKLGKEAINGAMTIKYRLPGSSDAQAQSGGGQTDDLVYIDEGSGLPVRIEAGLKNLNGVAGRVVIDTMNIRLNPDAAMFDVPAGTKKIDAGLLKPQVERLIGTLKTMAALMGRK